MVYINIITIYHIPLLFNGIVSQYYVCLYLFIYLFLSGSVKMIVEIIRYLSNVYRLGRPKKIKKHVGMHCCKCLAF